MAFANDVEQLITDLEREGLFHLEDYHFNGYKTKTKTPEKLFYELRDGETKIPSVVNLIFIQGLPGEHEFPDNLGKPCYRVTLDLKNHTAFYNDTFNPKGYSEIRDIFEDHNWNIKRTHFKTELWRRKLLPQS